MQSEINALTFVGFFFFFILVILEEFLLLFERQFHIFIINLNRFESIKHCAKKFPAEMELQTTTTYFQPHQFEHQISCVTKRFGGFQSVDILNILLVT